MTRALRVPGPIAMFLAFALAGALLVAAAQPAEASRSTQLEQRLTQLVNQARSANGLPPVTVKSDLTTVALAWSTQMGSTGQLAHNPLYSSQICCWQRVAENVGYASVSSADDPNRLAQRLHDGFMGSAGHRANILSPHFTEIGIGGVITDKGAYVTQNFRLSQNSSTPTSSGSSSTGGSDTSTTNTSTVSAPSSSGGSNGSSGTAPQPPAPAESAPATQPDPEPEPEPALSEEELAELRAERDVWLYVSSPREPGLWVPDLSGDYAPSQATLRYVARGTGRTDVPELSAADDGVAVPIRGVLVLNAGADGRG